MMANKEDFLQYMATIYDDMQRLVNEIPEYIRNKLQVSQIDNDLILYYFVTDKRTSDRIAKWVNHYDER